MLRGTYALWPADCETARLSSWEFVDVKNAQLRSTWEYLVISEAERERLQELGRHGWELVTVARDSAGGLLYLKRPGLTFKERVTLDQRRSYYEARGLHPSDQQSSSHG